MRRWFNALFVPLALCAGVAQAAPPEGLDARVVQGHIQPAYVRLAETTDVLAGRVSALCDAPGPVRLNAVRAAFPPAFLAWQGAQHLRFGPVQLFMREYRYDLWPDKRGTVGRHLARLIADVAKDPSTLEPRSFANGSVAVQGFSAMERLLYGEGIDRFDAPGFAVRCRVLGAIARNLRDMSAQIVANWADPLPPEDPAERDATLMANLNTELERVVAQKLALPLGSELAHARGSRAEGWRSGLSLAAIRENLIATRALYRLAYQGRAKQAGLDARVERAWSRALVAVEAVSMPLDQAVADSGAREQVERLRRRVSELKALITTELAPALDLTLGFNNLDGD